MNISRDSHHSEAAGATQPKQQKSRRFSFFRRSKKEKKDKQEKVKDNGPGRADFEQSTHNEWVMYQQSNQIDPSRQMPVTRPYDAFEEPSSPAYANVPLVNYQRNQYNGGLAALSDASPPPPFDPRSPRGYLPPDRFDISHQEISPPMKPAVPSRANVNNALSFKRQLEETIAAKKAVRDASPPIPRLPPIAEIPRPNHHASFRQRPPTQRPSDSRLRDSIVSEPPTDFV
uniref:Uncharacterized protein n=1 Tax=Plectus sambesii TaxID=2011161 RepID=A0A914V5P0_9BILA